MIKNNVMGKIITRRYKVEWERNPKTAVIEVKPKLKFEDDIEWKEILSFNGTNIRANNKIHYDIYISEKECVTVNEERFRSDLQEMMLYTTKEIEIIEQNKEYCEKELSNLLKEYNSRHIEKDEKLLSYCKIHKLNIEDTDFEELRELIYKENLNCCKTDLYSWLSVGSITYSNPQQTLL